MRRLIYMLAAIGCAEDSASVQTASDSSTRYTLRIENVAPWKVLKSGTHGTAPLAPGETFELRFTAGKHGHAVSFATMLGESNDWFFAPGPDGIPLVPGDVTKHVKLWDAGTEIDQELGAGDATAPQQPTPNYGPPDPDPRVRVVRDDISDLVQVMLVPRGDTEYALEISNCSGSMIHLSPFAWALHRMPAPLFTPGEPDRGDGLEALAEDGNPAELGASLAVVTGFHTPLSPGVVVVHRDAAPLFAVGERDYGDGLERIAEDGDPSDLAPLATVVFDTPVGASAPGPAMPGQAYEVELTASAGDRLSFATMFGMSNDWFFAPNEAGIAFEAGDVTTHVALYNAGTEIDQEIDIGQFTAPQQPAPNTGPADLDRTVRPADYEVPVQSHLRVTLGSGLR